MTTSVPVTAAQGRKLFTCELSIAASTTYQTFHDCWSGEMGRISTVQIWDATAGFGDHANLQIVRLRLPREVEAWLEAQARD